ncbi:MAG: hypothetical protein L6R41_005931 [Letrouitia leprolyta]|nr:MAG: hypothetical protein L6R41_005931 [Letrouitia leprolyta]
MARPACILATGFNAHGQLDPLSKQNNIYYFKRIEFVEEFKTSENTAIKAALWSSTIITDNHGMKHLGISGQSVVSHIDLKGIPKGATFFGDVSGILGYLDPSSGALYTLKSSSTSPAASFERCQYPSTPSPLPNEKIIAHIAIAANEKACLVVHSHEETIRPPYAEIHLHHDFPTFLHCPLTAKLHNFGEDIASLVATATSFAALTGTGRVLTFGDARYPALFGRTPSKDQPASIPHVVSALDGISIAKIVAGNWMIAALSCDKDLYVWGHMLPRTPVREGHVGFSTLLNTVDEDGDREEVHLVDVADGADVEDVAVGDEHVVVLTTKGEIWGLGSNEYGQLGLGEESKGTEGKWRKLDVPSEREKAVELKAGPSTTFLVTAVDDVT